MPDVFKILRDLEMKAVGVDPQTQAMQEGYFVSFRNVGLPIRTEDYEKPWSPIGVNLNKPVAEKPPADPANADTTASEQADTDAELQGISRAQRNYINTFLLTDRKLRMSNTYQVMPGASRLSDTWWAIMTGANGIPPKTDIKPELKAAYDKARAFLMDADENPTAKYQKYMDYRDKYRTAVKAYNRTYSAALTDPRKLGRFPNEGKIFQDDVDSAFDEWQGFGAKSEVERALATLAAQGTDPAIALIARCKRRWEAGLGEPVVGHLGGRVGRLCLLRHRWLLRAPQRAARFRGRLQWRAAEEPGHPGGRVRIGDHAAETGPALAAAGHLPGAGRRPGAGEAAAAGERADPADHHHLADDDRVRRVPGPHRPALAVLAAAGRRHLGRARSRPRRHHPAGRDRLAHLAADRHARDPQTSRSRPTGRRRTSRRPPPRPTSGRSPWPGRSPTGCSPRRACR
jgi:hypothetical protein